jgi:predicted PurR-regulated permease PerM
VAAERSEAVEAARTVVLGAGALFVAYLLLRPLAAHVSAVASGLLLSVALWAMARAVSRHTRLSYRVAVVIVIVTLLALMSALFAWTGPLLVEQLQELVGAVRRGVASAQAWLEANPMGRDLLERARRSMTSLGGGGRVIGGVATGVRTGVEALGGAALAVLLGVLLAINPPLYVDGALRLLPPARRARMREVVREASSTLRAWLAARLFLMIVIGSAFGTALAVLRVPLAFPLGVLTGVLAFIPYVGALLSVLPALAVAFVEGPRKALEVLLVYLVIQFAETYLLDPLVEARAVRLAPALVLLAQFVAAVWFGPVAVLYATPLLVVVVVAVRMLYLEDRLGEPRPEKRSRNDRRLRWPAFLRPRRT